MTVLRRLAGKCFGLFDAGLEFLNLTFEELVAVGEGGDLLFFLQVLLFESLDLGLELFGFRSILIRLNAERVHFLMEISESACHDGLCEKVGVAWCVRWQ